jgi:hypothetical protein
MKVNGKLEMRQQRRYLAALLSAESDWFGNGARESSYCITRGLYLQFHQMTKQQLLDRRRRDCPTLYHD